MVSEAVIVWSIGSRKNMVSLRVNRVVAFAAKGGGKDRFVLARDSEIVFGIQFGG